MTESLIDPFRHNSWATERLIEFCRELGTEQLEATSPGTYGSVLETLQHILGAEGRYRSRLSGKAPEWTDRTEGIADVDALLEIARDMTAFWESMFSSPFDPDRIISGRDRDGTAFEVSAGMLAAQVVNHGNEHRSQVFTILTTSGVEPPDLDGWSWGEATGRFSMKDG